MGNSMSACTDVRDSECGPIKVGHSIPSVELHAGFLPRGGRKFNMATETATGKVVILGLPGAFTPC